MKKIISIAILTIIVSFCSFAQKSEVYVSSGGEIIFSWAVIDNNGNENGNVMRFSPVFNIQNLVNIDVNPYVGFFTGLNIHNVGFIYDVPDTDIKYKYRNYTVGIPVGLKLGKLEKGFLFGGYEIEFPINYKEKFFENEVKEDKFNVWFSNRVPGLYHTVFGGFQLSQGASVKFKYYLTNFHNKDFTETINGIQNKPYENLNSNVFYVSLSFNVFNKDKFVTVKTDENRTY